MPRACLNRNGARYTVQGPTALTNRTARWRKREGGGALAPQPPS